MKFGRAPAMRCMVAAALVIRFVSGPFCSPREGRAAVTVAEIGISCDPSRVWIVCLSTRPRKVDIPRYSHCDGYGRNGRMSPRSEEHTSDLQSLMRISYA